MDCCVLHTLIGWYTPSPRLKSRFTQISPYSRGWWLMAVDLHPFRGLAPTVVLCHHYVVLFGVLRYRGLRCAPPTAVIFHRYAVLCGCLAIIMHYALCIMNYALKKAHGWDPITANAVPSGICICFKLSALGFKLREAVNYELFCFSNPLCFLYQNQN